MTLVPAGPTPLALPDVSILAGQLAPSSQRMYRRDIAAYLAWCATRALPGAEASSLAQYRAYLASGSKSPNTINRELSAIKALAREAAAQGYLDAERAARFAGVRGVRVLAMKTRLKAHAKTRIAPADLRRLCDSPDPATPAGLRDRALLWTLATSGVRVGEAVRLTADAIQTVGEGHYLIYVCGKTDITPRPAPLAAEAAGHITAWLTARDLDSPYVFTATRGRRVTPLSAAAAWLLVRKYATAAGLEHVSPHDFRRAVATQLTATAGIRAAQLALGHKSIATTQRYDLTPLQPGLTENLF